MARQGNSKGARERAAKRRIEALEFRKSGLHYREIGERLDVSTQQAHRDVMRELNALAKIATGEAEKVRALEEYRLDALLAILWPQAAEGDYGAVDRILRVMQRRATLCGLDKETSTYNAKLTVEPMAVSISQADINAALRELTNVGVIAKVE